MGYILEEDMTLTEIAAKKKVPLELLAKWNHLPLDATVQKGNRIDLKY